MNFNQSLAPCIALSKLQTLTLLSDEEIEWNLEIPPIFDVIIIIREYEQGICTENKMTYNYKNYNNDKWKRIFCKSINIK